MAASPTADILNSKWLRDEGFKANKDLPEVAGAFSGDCVVIASGRCVWGDLENVNIYNADVLVVNDIGMHLPCEIRHWFSMHGDQIPTWVTARGFRYKGYDSRLMTHSCGYQSHVQHVWPWPGHGTSGLNAIYTALGLGYESVTVAGMPLDDSGHYFDPPDESSLLRYGEKHAWTNFNREAKESIWENACKQVFNGRVRFLSGRAEDWTT